MTSILSELRGGDRRSIGKVSAVITAIRNKPGKKLLPKLKNLPQT